MRNSWFWTLTAGAVLGVALLLTTDIAPPPPDAQPIEVARVGVVREPLLPQERVVPPAPIMIVQLPPSRTFWLTWKYPNGSDTTKAIGVIYRSLDGSPFTEFMRSPPGATSLSLSTSELGRKHCYYIVAVIGKDAAPQSQPYCQIIIAVPQAEDLKIE